MTIKKPYVSLVEFLESNKNKNVSSILEEVKLMCESKKVASTVIYHKDGTVKAVFCYYHKQWEILKDTPYGSKANTQSGLNTMCKVGTSKWTKAQRDATLANASILTDVASGELEPSKILEKQAEIETSRLAMNTTDMPKGITVDELNKHIKKFNSQVTS